MKLSQFLSDLGEFMSLGFFVVVESDILDISTEFVFKPVDLSCHIVELRLLFTESPNNNELIHLLESSDCFVKVVSVFRLCLNVVKFFLVLFQKVP